MAQRESHCGDAWPGVNTTVLFAARVLNLRLMGKQANVYRRFHCFDLADQLYR